MRIPVSEPNLGEEELANVIEAVQSGWVSSKGEFINRFEQEFAAKCGAKYGVATANGTVALHLALTALGIGHGDEVLVPSLTFVATANAVAYTGATPVFVDSTPDYWCIDPVDLERRVTSHSKAVIPVHLYGHPADMGPILEVARRHNLVVIEDAAEAHGAEYKGRKVGSLGAVGCFSFFGNKIITTGEGGMCVTSDEALYRDMLILRDHGADPKRSYWYDRIGFNYRMTNLQAAIGVAQLHRLDEFVERKREIARWYSEALKGVNGLQFPVEAPWAKNVYWMYCLVLNGFSVSRDGLRESLADEGIETRPFFWAMHLLPPHKRAYSLPQAERLCRNGLNLPSSTTLKQEQAERIVAAIIKASDVG